MKRFVLAVFAVLVFLQCDDESPFQELTVVNGSGSGVYELGRRVQITADAPPDNEAFYSWEGDIEHLEDEMAPVTTVRIPLGPVTVEATYRDLPRYSLTVTNGTGSGEYLEGTRVLVEAEMPADGFAFDRWNGDTLFLESTTDMSTYVMMPAEPVAVEATYEENIALVSFSMTVWPIFESKCSYAGCHDQNDPNWSLTSYQEIRADIGQIEESIRSDRMPSTGSLTAEEKEAIFLWIEQGAMNN